MANYRMTTSNRGYWHTSTRGEPSFIGWFDEADMIPDFCYGPFPTFEKARADAIAFHKDEILLAKSNICLLRAMSAPE